MLLGDLENLNALLILEARRLTCSSKRHENIDTRCHLSVDKRCKSIIINCTILEWGDQGGSAT